ncbi:hypothetical protein Q4F19_07100 [Sphingomonas sp. BIUV-7]|uniref:Uncharacterized protein n=1 Tax=Sphingomonas natans TaxID=3063330 RepID=A0ABT8Y745_9SPHN|nr:hypothetical protein [Sphingomonas sp. BIUV-7]MDO6414143.1 hypothetical protein [Sphingomonas sp. BIUV-7]
MTAEHRHYLAAETSIGFAISAVLSLVFCFFIFGGQASIPVGGTGGLIVDAIPQSFMVALMSTFVPTLLTRRRVRSGAIPVRKARSRLPTHAMLRALLVACCAAGIGVLLTAIALLAGPDEWPFVTVATVKTVYGALLGGSVAALATCAALADPT